MLINQDLLKKKWKVVGASYKFRNYSPTNEHKKTAYPQYNVNIYSNWGVQKCGVFFFRSMVISRLGKYRGCSIHSVVIE